VVKGMCVKSVPPQQGVQCAEDAVMAAERGLEGIVCSNHGGRQVRE